MNAFWPQFFIITITVATLSLVTDVVKAVVPGQGIKKHALEIACIASVFIGLSFLLPENITNLSSGALVTGGIFGIVLAEIIQYLWRRS